MSGALRCTLVTYRGPEPSISLGFELENTGPETWQGSVLEPVIPWDLEAWVGGEKVAVSQPALDVPGRMRPLELEAGGRVELPCPIVLAFDDPSRENGGDRFTWILASPPAAVELRASINVDGEQLETERVTVAAGA
jgi:hypothetical protein